MILWFGIALMVVAALAALVTAGAGALKKTPNDITLGATLLVALGLIAQVIISIIAPMAGNPPRGDALEFWMYLVTAVILPPGAIFWALIDRTRWANMILGLVNITVVVMVWRMLVIWGAFA